MTRTDGMTEASDLDLFSELLRLVAMIGFRRTLQISMKSHESA